MFSLNRLTLRDLIRLVAVGIVIVFVASAVSIAYAAGRHSSLDQSQQGRVSVTTTDEAALR